MSYSKIARKTIQGSQGTHLNKHSNSLKKSQLIISQGKFKKGDVVSDADDDEVRTNASQNHVTATLCTEEFFLRAPYTYMYISPLISAERCGGGGGK
jgi:hypothetical protein